MGSYVGNQELMANAMINRDKLNLATIHRIHSETYREGQVIGQNPPAKDMVEEFSDIELWISLGPDPNGSRILTVEVQDSSEDSFVSVYAGPVLIYEGFPQEKELEIPVCGEGEITYQIYMNGEPSGTQTITFESPEEGQ